MCTIEFYRCAFERCTKMMAFWLRIDEITKSANRRITAVVNVAAVAAAVGVVLLLMIIRSIKQKPSLWSEKNRLIHTHNQYVYVQNNTTHRKRIKEADNFLSRKQCNSKMILVTFKLTTKRTWQNIWRQQRKILSKLWFCCQLFLKSSWCSVYQNQW